MISKYHHSNNDSVRKTPVSYVYKLEGKVGDMPKLENQKMFYCVIYSFELILGSISKWWNFSVHTTFFGKQININIFIPATWSLCWKNGGWIMEIIYVASGYCQGSKVHALHEEQTVWKRVNRACKVGEVNLTVVIVGEVTWQL